MGSTLGVLASRIILTLALTAVCAAAAAASDRCAALKGLHLPGIAMEIDRTEHVPARPLPPMPFGPSYAGIIPSHCRVDGAIDRRLGRNGKPYAIGFAIALPDQWNGRFLFQGGGGLNGSVNPPVGFQAAGDTPALARGFAVVSTDSGHQSAAVFDASFFEDQEAALNFLYQAVGKVTVAAKQIIHHHYAKPAERSYYVGCSTGGREAMLMTQRHPSYFDGVVAGAPAMRTSYSNLALQWISTAFNEIAPRDESGNPVGSRALSESDKKLIVSAVLKACDAGDGLQDGMIFNTRGCRFDPAELACKDAKSDACLTLAQTQAVAKAFAGPRNSRGAQVYPGFLYDTGIAAAGGPGRIPGLLSAVQSPVGPPNLATTMDVDAEAAEAATPEAALGDSYSWTNLSTFSGRGGKLIFYHGISDPWFSAADTTQYYEALTAANGGADKVQEWSRLFLVPGMGHCMGGETALDRFDLLGAVVGWVEKDEAPETVVATGQALPGRSRPLCPYPEHAHYRGRGDPDLAGSFECRK